MIKKIQIKNRFTGNVIFEHECKDNRIKKTAEEAVRNGKSLHGADLYGTNLHGADLRGADLNWADLNWTDLRGADLNWADLHGADLRGADLRGADLYGTNLYGTNLNWADLRGAKNIPYIPLECPSDGAFTGWKKIQGCIVELEIPTDAKRSSGTTRKCRCDKAKVISIKDEEGNDIEEIVNTNYVETTYKVGEMVYADSFDEDRFNECSHGIHFFVNKQDTIDY